MLLIMENCSSLITARMWSVSKADSICAISLADTELHDKYAANWIELVVQVVCCRMDS